MNNIIRAENLIKAFGEGNERRNVLNGVSVEINSGEFVTVMGPSGSGKSTLLFAISGMDGIDSGKVIFDGKSLASYKENELADLRRTAMGFVFQQPTMLKSLNLLDNIMLPSMRNAKNSTKALAQKAVALMQKVGINGLEQRDVAQVSGGQLQRAGICRALMADPKIILGDEPTGALNTKSADEVMDIFSAINADGTAIMLVTHDARVAARAGRVLFMCDGQIVSEMRLDSSNDAAEKTAMIAEKMRQIGI